MRKKSRKPLAGIRVLDLTRLLPGPLCTVILADLGAEVIKIESPGEGDYARSTPFFDLINRNKKTLTLDLKNTRDQNEFYALAKKTDIVIESFRPGVVKKLKVDYPTLKKINEKLIYCSITGYGQTGPLKNLPGHDINFLALGGVLDQMGRAGGPPTLSNFQIADVSGALMSCIGLLSAIIDVKNGGPSRAIDISLMESAIGLSIIPYISKPLRGSDILSGAIPAYNIYETKDGRYMAVGAYEKKFWKTFCEILEKPHLIEHGWAQGKKGAEVFSEIEQAFKAHRQAYWTEKFLYTDTCVTPVLNFKEAETQPFWKARKLSKNHQLRTPIRMTDFEPEIKNAAPLKREKRRSK